MKLDRAKSSEDKIDADASDASILRRGYATEDHIASPLSQMKIFTYLGIDCHAKVRHSLIVSILGLKERSK